MQAQILIAEDEPYIAASLEFLLDNDGYQTQIARDGMTALAIAKASPPDLIVLDLMLPKLSGLEVAAAIRANVADRQPKILMLTARGGAGDVARSRLAGVDAYLVKPFSTKELLESVRHLLATKGRAHAA